MKERKRKNRAENLPLWDKKFGKIVMCSKPIEDAKLKFFPERYTVNIPKHATPLLQESTKEVIHVDEKEAEELLTNEMEYTELEEVKEENQELSEMNLTQLRAYAKEKGIKGTGRKDRELLMELLSNLK